MVLERKKIISHCLIVLIALFLEACAGVRQGDIGVKDEEAVRLVKEGAKLYDEERYGEALGKFSEAEMQAAMPEDKIKIADILFKGGFVLSEKKLFKTAISYYERSLEINRTLNDKPELVNNYSHMGKAYADIGKYEEGIRHFKEALKIQEELNDKAGIAHNLNNVANLYSYLGGYTESIGILTRALQVSEEIKDSEQTARTLINLGTVNFRLRNYERSVELLNRAFGIADRTGEGGLKATTLSLMGVVNRSQGNYVEALDYYKRALEINKKLKLKSDVAVNLSIIGELYKESGRYDEALGYLQDSLKMSETLNDKLMTAVNLNYMGEVKYKQKKYEEASKFYDLSLKVFRELGFKDRIARSYNNIGYLRGEMREWDNAFENFDKAIAMYKDLGDREWVRVALFGKGVYLEKKGDLVSAERSYKEAVDVFESIREDVSGGEEAERLFSEVNVKLYENLVSLLLRLGKKEEALEYIERNRSKTLRDTFLRNGISSYDEGTRGLLERFERLFRREASVNRELMKEKIKPLPNPEKIQNLVKTLAKTRQEFERINSELMSRYPEIYGFLSVQPGTFLDMKHANILPSNAVFLEYFMTEEVTYIFAVNRENLIVKSVSVRKSELNELVRLFRDLLKMNRSVPVNGWRDDGSVTYKGNLKPLKDVSLLLYHYLIKPVEGEIRTAETVAIIPFGPLHYLPFHALLNEGKDGDLRFFIEEKNLIYLVSASDAYLDMVLRNGREREIGSVVAFGNPDLGESELVLPYSEVEVLAIKKKFPNATVFVQKDATRDNFKHSWGGHEVVHLAAHGLIQGEPSILLAPLGSGTLTLSDITELPPMGKTNLVVLSACESAVDRNAGSLNGVELNSIAMAFTMIGTPSVIATLWRVHDRATSELMEIFYENLKEEGRVNYRALRKAQISMLRRSDKYSQPFYWAPFILLGVWE